MPDPKDDESVEERELRSECSWSCLSGEGEGGGGGGGGEMVVVTCNCKLQTCTLLLSSIHVHAYQCSKQDTSGGGTCSNKFIS